MPIWKEYEHDREKLFYDAEMILANMKSETIEKRLKINYVDLECLFRAIVGHRFR